MPEKSNQLGPTTSDTSSGRPRTNAESFATVVKAVLSSGNMPLTPQEIRIQIKKDYPHLYSTPKHLENVKKGHFQDPDHALLAQIYGVVRKNKAILTDETHKPMRFSLKTFKQGK